MAKNVIINGNVYSDVPYLDVPKADNTGDASFFDTTDADFTSADLLNGKSAYGASGKTNGGMTNNGAVSGTISTKAGQYTVPAGYHNGSGVVQISSAEQAKIVSGNIRSGVTLLGQAGKSTVVDTEIASGGAGQGQILNGYKGYVNGSLVEGNATVPTISQNATTKVLRIS